MIRPDSDPKNGGDALTGDVLLPLALESEDTTRQVDAPEETIRAADALRCAEARYRGLLDSIETGIVVQDSHGRVIGANPMAARLLGVSVEQLIGVGLLDPRWSIIDEELAAVPPESRPPAVALRSGLAVREVPLGLQLPDGEIRWLLVSSVPVRATAPGDDPSLVTSLVNITRRKDAEAERERLLIRERQGYANAERRAGQIRALLSSLTEAVVIMDADGRIVLRNEMAREISGESDDRTEIGLRTKAIPLYSLDGTPIPAEDLPIMRTLRGERFAEEEYLLGRADGSTRRVVVGGTCLRGDDGAVVLGIVVTRDVTDLRQLEHLKDEYLSLVSHDLRNPLTSLMGLTDWLRRTLVKRELAAEARIAENVLKSAGRMNAMIQDLAESARLESGRFELRPQQTDLSKLLAEIVERSAVPDEAARLRVDDDGTLPAMSVDANRLERAIANLVSNALKFSPADRPVVIRLHRTRDEAVISVADQGPGIVPDEVGKLFQRFYQSSTTRREGEGLGLGLYIARMIVEAHGGRISVSTSPGAGSIFSIALPIEKAPQTDASADLD